MYTVDYLKSRRVWFEELLHLPASSSAKRAHSVHVPGRRVAKTVLFKANDRYVLAVLPSTCRVDLERLSQSLGMTADDLRLAPSDEVVVLFNDCEPGVVPPFGRLYDLETILDSSLAEVNELIFAGNTRHEGLRMRSDDYIAIEKPVIASFAAPIDPKRPLSTLPKTDRRAG